MSLSADIAAHDSSLASRGLTIWIGAEPTFTRADSLDPCWLFEAEGGDKDARARALLRALAPRLSPSAALCRSAGRHFPEEPAPRFAYGARWHRRDDAAPASSDLDGAAEAAPAPDPDWAWMTVTPDPGVVEVNLAPATDLAGFARTVEATYAAAAAVGLSPQRWRWNGEVTDSGGGGQVTLGGPRPEDSPFFRHPHLLPGLLVYLNRHPSLSYAFASECVGSASQGPRPDEGDGQRFAELGLALAALQARRAPSPLALWGALAPLLVDGAGNSHRAEVNIEKLWNPHLPGRGCLGLVELRALRMEPTPARMVAVAALIRAVAARLAAAPLVAPLIEWGRALHDRCALPTALAADLDEVLEDLAAHGFGLGPALTALLRDRPAPALRLDDGPASLTVTPAREFWPLVGDVASQERRGARIVDASSARLELVVEGGDPVWAAGRPLPLQPLPDGRHLVAVRHRAFVPQPGFHPDLPALDPLPLHWRGRRIALHGWRPGGGGYAELPADAAEAARRRAERVVITPAEEPPGPPAPPPPAGAAFTVDLRLPGPL